MKEADDKKIYILMNKPAGFVCSAVSDSHQTVYQLLPPEFQLLLNEKRGQRLHTVGRLDCDTTGLLLITNDGIFSHQLTAPESHVEKKYLVTLEIPLSEQQQQNYINYFSKPHLLPPEKKAPEQIVAPAKIEFLKENLCVVTLQEGKFHQVRRMFLGIQNTVIQLKRIKFGNFCLPEQLKEGNWQIIDGAKL